MERVLELSSRKENIRPKKVSSVLKFDLDTIHQHFIDNCYAIESQFEIYDDLMQKRDVDKGNLILRSMIVLLDSAFDFYLHEITKLGVTKMFDGEWNKTDKYCNIKLKLTLVEKVIKNEEIDNWFLEFVNNYYSEDTLVSFESFKDHLNLLGLDLKKIADDVFYQRGATEKTDAKLKRRINELYKRRNIIAHQFDRKHEDASFMYIDKTLVEEFIADLKKIVEAINKQILEKN